MKELEFVHEEAELVSYRVKPNYRSLGPRFGKEMPQAAAAVEALDAEHVAAALEAGARSGSRSTATTTTLSRRRRQPGDGAARGLRGRGRGRPRRRAGAGARRRAAPRGPGARDRPRGPGRAQAGRASRSPTGSSCGLAGDDELLAAAREHEAYIAGETLATSVGYGADGAGEKATIEGRELVIGVSG